ncbi:MAG TPA: glycosyltransferase 87 family protein [Ktedonobacterales bacterium]
MQDLLEFPRKGIRDTLGKPLTSLLVFIVLGGSLALLFVALHPRLPSRSAWRWLRSRRLQAIVLVAIIAPAIIGARQVGVMSIAGFLPPQYPNDGTTLDHEAARQLLAGHNPYVTVDIVTAIRRYGQRPQDTTPLGRGAFAALYPQQYPTPAEMNRVFASEPVGQPEHVLEFESHVSYPALAFLPLVPFVWAGMPSVVIFFALCFFALAALLISAVPPHLRAWVGLLILADLPLLNAAVGGVLDVFYILLLFVAWRWWRQPVLSTVFLGLAIAAKQLAWFFLPFYTIYIWRERGRREALSRLAGAGGVFALINGPFILNDPRAWLAGVMAPQVDPMFPLGNGFVGLSVSGLLPLAPSVVYSVLFGLAIIVCIAWYWHFGRRMPEVALLLAVLPLFFAWRSLTTYFYFVALPAVVLLIYERTTHRGKPTLAFSGPVDTETGRAEMGDAQQRGRGSSPTVSVRSQRQGPIQSRDMSRHVRRRRR